MGSIRIHREMANLGNINIFFRDTKTDGPPILCLHGRWGRGETWVDFMQHYGGKYRIIAPDQRGHGLSDKPVSKYTAVEMSADMIALLDHLKIGSAIIVGHSMGGHIAGTMAANHSQYVKAVAILDKSAGGPDKPSSESPDKLTIPDPETKEWPMPFQSMSEAQECIRKYEKSDLSYQYFMNSLTETVEGYRMMFSTQAICATIAYYENWFHLLPKITCPVLLIRAGGGENVSDEEFLKMQSLLRNCLAFEMSHPDHNVQLANKDEFYSYFDKFLLSIEH